MSEDTSSVNSISATVMATLSARLADAERERDELKGMQTRLANAEDNLRLLNGFQHQMDAEMDHRKELELEIAVMRPVVEAADMVFRKYDKDGIWTQEDAKHQLQQAIITYRAAKGG